MNHRSIRPSGWARGMALAALLGMVGGLAGCGRGSTSSEQSYPPGGPGAPQQGMSTRQKVVLLAGAAALYYLYNKHKNSKGQGKTGQYYLSKNGRVYYRDQNGKPVWVTPPPQGIQIPESEAQQYSDYKGYNGQTEGQSFGGYGALSTAMPGGPSGAGQSGTPMPGSPPGPPGPPGR